MLYGLRLPLESERVLKNAIGNIEKNMHDFTMGIVFFSKGYPMSLILNSFVDLLLQCHGKKWLILQGFTVRFDAVFESRVHTQSENKVRYC